MAEDDGRDQPVVEVATLHLAVDAVREAPAGGDRHRCECLCPGYIADRENMLDVGLLVLVDGYESPVVGRDAGRIERQ